jgi:hemerythrin
MVQWSDEYSVGVDSLDTDHKLLISMINQLEIAVGDTEPKARICSVLDALVDYTVYHFEREERMMEQAGYPDTEAHARSHQTLAAQVREIRERFNRNSQSIHGRELLAFLNNWLRAHIVGRDLRYAPYLADTDLAELSSNAIASPSTTIRVSASRAS